MQTERTAASRPLAERMPVTPWMRGLAWGLLSFAGFVSAIVALVWPVGQLEQASGLTHPVALGAWALTWVVASGLLALLSARIVFGEWLEVRPAAWLILLSGAVVSAATVTILADWTIAKFGINESELAGPMSLLFGVVAGVAVGGFGVQVAPRWAMWSPLLPVAGGAVMGAAIILSNASGMSDGLGSHSGPLAVITVVAALYVGAVGVLSLARLRRT